MAHVITKGAGKVKHVQAPGGGTLCGIPSGRVAKAGGPGLKRQLCAACAAQSGAAKKASAR